MLIQGITTHIIRDKEKQTEDLAKFWSQLAKNCYFGHKYEGAALLHKQALMLYLRVLAANHAYTTEALRRLEELDKLDLAKQKELETLLQQLGTEYSQFVDILFYLARDYNNAERYELAIWYYLRVIHSLLHTLPQGNKMLQNSFKSLGHMYTKMGEKENATNYFEEYKKLR